MSDLLHQTRRYPAAKYPWLRVQIVQAETRPMLVPIYGGKKGNILIGHRQEATEVPVLRLLGYGETVAQAKAMAKKAVAHE